MMRNQPTFYLRFAVLLLFQMFISLASPSKPLKSLPNRSTFSELYKRCRNLYLILRCCGLCGKPRKFWELCRIDIDGTTFSELYKRCRNLHFLILRCCGLYSKPRKAYFCRKNNISGYGGPAKSDCFLLIIHQHAAWPRRGKIIVRGLPGLAVYATAF